MAETFGEARQYRKSAQYWICVPMMRTCSLDTCTIDKKYLVVERDPGAYFALVPPQDVPQPKFSEVVFYANCVAYEHDVPTRPISKRARRSLFVPLVGRHSQEMDDEWLESSWDELASRRLAGRGLFASVRFRRPQQAKEFDLPYSGRFGSISEMIAIYATALRQFDPLAEFLHYYRVLEHYDRGKGLDAINEFLPDLENRRFGCLLAEIETPNSRGKSSERVVNILSAYKRRAVARRNELKKRGPELDIARYLYGQVRCGIAHGKTGIKTFDFETNITDVARDIPLVKILARAAIERKIPADFQRRPGDDR